MISEVNIKLNEEKKELEQFIKELGKRITEKESISSSSPNKTPSKEEENNEKLRPLLKGGLKFPGRRSPATSDFCIISQGKYGRKTLFLFLVVMM